jgi:hypothetical protein
MSKSEIGIETIHTVSNLCNIHRLNRGYSVALGIAAQQDTQRIRFLAKVCCVLQVCSFCRNKICIEYSMS